MAKDGDQTTRTPVPANEPDWLTLGQAAKYLGMAQSTIRKWSDGGACPPSTRRAATGATGAATSISSSSAAGRSRRGEPRAGG